MADKNRTGPLDWEDVRVFVALARHGTLSQTARSLGLNHATVARRVAGLEAALGRALFDRRPTGYVLTAAGRDALEEASAMAEAAAALGRRQPGEHLSGLVRITATRSVGEGFLLPRLGEWQRHHPDLDLELIPAIRAMSLARHEADLALRFGRPADGEMVARRVATIGYGFYAAAGWRDRLAAGEPPVFIGFDEAGAQVPEAQWLTRHFPAARVAVRLDSHVAQAVAARAGGGVALLPHFLAAGDGLLHPVLLAPLPPARDLFLLSRPGASRIPRLRAAAEFLVELFRRESPPAA